MEKKAYFILISLALFSMLFSCNESSQSGYDPNINKQGILQEKEAVKATVVKMWDAIENEDIETYASYIHPDFTQFGENDPVLREGKTAEVNGIDGWIKSSKDIHTEMEEPQVVIKGAVAWIVYYWKDSGVTNGEPFSTRGKSTRIFVKEDGKWLCIHGHYTLLP
jgi:ketosteroid isomerase-like protein